MRPWPMPAAARPQDVSSSTTPPSAPRRMRDGLSVLDLPVEAEAKAAAQVRWGLLQPDDWRQGRLVLTQRGRLLADAVVRDLM